jgi:predicted outer membrane protein
MVKSVCLKVLLFGIIFSTLVFSGYALARPQDTQRSRGQTPPYVPNSIPNTPDSQRSSDRTADSPNRNADPVIQAVQINLAEIEAGKIAAKKAQNPRVKEFADMIVKDHTQALAKLRPLPGGELSGVKPDGKHQQAAERLGKLSGAEFDREYMDAMVHGHREALMFFERHSHGQPAANGQSDSKSGTARAGEPGVKQKPDAHAPSGAEYNPEFSKVAAKLVPTVRQHLQMAEQIYQELQSGNSRSNSSQKTKDPAPHDHPESDRDRVPDK